MNDGPCLELFIRKAAYTKYDAKVLVRWSNYRHDVLWKDWTERGLVYILKGRISIACYHVQRPSLFIRDKPILSSERMLRKKYDDKNSIATKPLAISFKRLGAKMKGLAINRQLLR
jgi:hypothetical protein